MSESLLLPGTLAVATAVFAHACFQLAVSVLTLLSSHSLGLRRSHLRVLALSLSYTIGAFVGTATLAAAVAYLLEALLTQNLHSSAAVAGLNIGVGLAVILFYYRKGKGTMLWLPRSGANYLSARAKKTRNTFEAFALGLMTVFTEFPFIIAPISVVGLIITGRVTPETFNWVLAYSVVAILPLLVVTALIGSGHSISTIQRWRESNKTFLQFASGGALIVLGCYIITSTLKSGGLL